ncbi:MAG: SAM-dependent DNA methyltransferase [Ignavibacteria bacterium]|nr:SAM-dependent DNA methyltransferase [Ignavibacteria bacterium]
MQTTHTIEKTRLTRQRDLDGQKTHAERNKLGQFATPPQLALDILRQTKKYLDPAVKVRFLDPAFGTGSFYSALLQVFPAEAIESATGFEIDSHYGDEAQRLWADSPLILQIEDFFSIPIRRMEIERANLMVCNPPYVRHHHLSISQKEHFSRAIASSVGLKVNGLSGLYCYFLIYSHNWLAENGIGCWLIPSEFMDVNYGTVVKEYLLGKVTLLRIHRFDPNESQFDDALVSSSVIWFRKTPPPIGHTVELTFGGTSETPRVVKHIASSELLGAQKWTRFTTNGQTKTTGKEVRLSNLFDVKRGLATGDNGFFILTPEEIREHNLPTKFLIPILPSPRYLKNDAIKADSKGNPLIENARFLLSCKVAPQQVKRDYPTLWKYFESGVKHQVNEGYLCQHRTPWYAQEDRPASPFLCTYMGRHDSPKGTPFRFIFNLSKATAANVYLFLYPKPALARFLKAHPGRVRMIWKGLQSISSDSLVHEGRVYGGGLHKMEPRELANVSAENILDLLPELHSLLAVPSVEQSLL